MKKAVISGATGIVGRALAKTLIADGIEVLLLVRPDSARDVELTDSALVCKVFCDMQSYDTLSLPADAAYDVFFHLAWQGSYGAAREDAALQEENVIGTECAVRLAARLGCHTFIAAGSQAEYGCVPMGTRIDEELATEPTTAYGAAKCKARLQTRTLCRAYGMRHIWARLFSVYGPHDRAETLVMSAISAFLKGEEKAFTRGEQCWDYLYSEDAARALALLAKKGVDGECYNVASGEARTLAEYITAIKEVVAPACEIRMGELPYRKGAPMSLCADIAKLQRDTGFSPCVSFAQGVRRTAQWLTENFVLYNRQ